MSTLVTSNISDGTTSVGTGYVVNGSAKAYCFANQTGAQSIQGSFNVSSLTDIAVGQTQVNLTAAMSDAFYCCSGASETQSTWASSGCNFIPLSASVSKMDRVENAAGYDALKISTALHGDLA